MENQTKKRWALRPEELAEKLGISTKTLLRWRTAGNGPRWVKRGMVILYPQEDVLRRLNDESAV